MPRAGDLPHLPGDDGKEATAFKAWRKALWEHGPPPMDEVFSAVDNGQNWLRNVWRFQLHQQKAADIQDVMLDVAPSGSPYSHNANNRHTRDDINRLFAFYRVKKEHPPKAGAPRKITKKYTLDGAGGTISSSAGLPIVSHQETAKIPAKVKVVNKDCLAQAQDYKARQQSTAVLNLANAYSCGGGVERGCSAQEEDIFRRTDADNCFDDLTEPRRNWDKSRKYKDKGALLTRAGCLYTAGVQVLYNARDAKDGDKPTPYSPLSDSEKFTVNLITAAGCDLRSGSAQRESLVLDGRPNYVEFVKRTRDKIRNLLQVAIKEEQKNLILGAISSGAFHSFEEDSGIVPKGFTGYLVAKVYEELLIKQGLAAHFDNVDFAVLGTGQPNKVFDQVLGGDATQKQAAQQEFAKALQDAGMGLDAQGVLIQQSAVVDQKTFAPKALGSAPAVSPRSAPKALPPTPSADGYIMYVDRHGKLIIKFATQQARDDFIKKSNPQDVTLYSNETSFQTQVPRKPYRNLDPTIACIDLYQPVGGGRFATHFADQSHMQNVLKALNFRNYSVCV